MEYGDVATEKAFRKERRVILIRTIGFVVIFLMLHLTIIEFPADWSQWFELLGLLLLVSVVMFITNYISLKRSYLKNKDLL